MPQLDKVHFFSQYFWLCVFFFGFYFLVAKYFLPRMARIIQFRKSKLNDVPQDQSNGELELVKSSANTALENVFSTSQRFWLQNSQRMDKWYGERVANINNNYLKECNNLYIKRIGDYSLSQDAALAPLNLAGPGSGYVFSLLGKIKNTVNSKQSTKGLYSTTTMSQSQPSVKKVSKKNVSNDKTLDAYNSKKTKKSKK